MNAGQSNPKTLNEAVKFFADLDVAHTFFTNIRWPDGAVSCPTCGSDRVLYLAKQRRWECREKHPRRQFSVKVGTVLEDSPMGLDKWAVAFWLEVNAKNSISSYEIGRALGITQKSAWFMLHRIRLAMKAKSLTKMGGAGGAVEADETYLGGKAEFMHAAKRKRVVTGTGAFGSGKTAVMGLLERHTGKGKSKVRAMVIKDTKRETVQAIIRQHVDQGTAVYTDALAAYRGLSPEFIHAFIVLPGQAFPRPADRHGFGGT